ncbi:MAG: MBL fold metallo-hydrolase [Bacteriovorax sp.]|jgi:sulfur dioxygenase|nr:MBL fold metallo-hydrolase [Bacteriovorax sp.]
MIFHQLFEPETSTYTYLLADEVTKEAILIDTVKETAERDLKLLNEMGLQLKFLIDTHIHADHITGAGFLRQKTGAKTAVSKHANVECTDIQLTDGDIITFGHYQLKALETPGHTNSCMSFLVDSMLFSGDVLMIRATGRTDFQQGSPEKMYASITQKIFTLPPETKIFPGHDYKGFSYSTVELEKKFNPRIGGNKNVAEFSQIMNDLKLSPPKKIDIAVAANMKCGLESGLV